MFPQYDSKHIFDEIERGVKLFGSDKTTDKIEICLGGYALRRVGDGYFWGTDDGHAYSIFTEKEYAQVVQTHMKNMYPEQKWEIIYVGAIWLDKDPREK